MRRDKVKPAPSKSERLREARARAWPRARADELVECDPIFYRFMLGLRCAAKVRHRAPSKTHVIDEYEKHTWEHLMIYLTTLELPPLVCGTSHYPRKGNADAT